MADKKHVNRSPITKINIVQDTRVTEKYYPRGTSFIYSKLVKTTKTLGITSPV